MSTFKKKVYSKNQQKLIIKNQIAMDQHKIQMSLSLAKRAWRNILCMKPNLHQLFKIKTWRFPIDEVSTNLFDKMNSVDKISWRRLPEIHNKSFTGRHEKTIESIKTPYMVDGV